MTLTINKWPNFFIVGAGKAGTSSLNQYFKKYSDIFMSPVKEPNFFSAATIPKSHPVDPIRDKNQYLKLFEKGTNKKIIGESSPTYLTDPKSPKLIYDVAHDAKILISLRNPIDRLFSEYWMKKNRGGLTLSFHEELSIRLKNPTQLGLQYGIYFENVKRYFEIFGKDQVKVIIFEELLKDPIKILREILNFLQLEYDSKIIFKPYNRYNENKFGPKQKMELKDRALLKKFYEKDVLELKKLLGRNLPWDDFNKI